jgi:hypothetical protein
MAAHIVPVSGSPTPFSKMFILVGDNDGAEVVRTITDLTTDLIDGPLKATLLGCPTLDIDHFNVDQARGSEIRIYDIAAVSTDAVVPRASARRIRWVAGANAGVAGLSCTVTAGDVITIEVRLNHSTQA